MADIHGLELLKKKLLNILIMSKTHLIVTDYGYLLVKQGLYKLLKARKDSLKNAIKRNDITIIERRKLEIEDIDKMIVSLLIIK